MLSDSHLAGINESLGLSLHDEALVSDDLVNHSCLVKKVGISRIVVGRHPPVSHSHATNVDPGGLEIHVYVFRS